MLSRKRKVAYVQTKHLAVDGVVSGERFTCLMEVMASEAKAVLPNYIEDSRDCMDLLGEGGGTQYSTSVAFIPFVLRIGR
ncbi:MAG: hypothetical protein MK180_16325 [Rhodobacteraceae bacterium]|nr:hypothetical protein [Paracoccaceae bacterium]